MPLASRAFCLKCYPSLQSEHTLYTFSVHIAGRLKFAGRLHKHTLTKLQVMEAKTVAHAVVIIEHPVSTHSSDDLRLACETNEVLGRRSHQLQSFPIWLCPAGYLGCIKYMHEVASPASFGSSTASCKKDSLSMPQLSRPSMEYAFALPETSNLWPQVCLIPVAHSH